MLQPFATVPKMPDLLLDERFAGAKPFNYRGPVGRADRP